MRSLLQDLRLGLRTLKKAPASAVVTSITLALGIGLCTVSFSLVYAVFFRGLDVPEASRLTLIWRTNPSRDIDYMGVNRYDLYDWREQQTSFEGLAMFTTGTVNLSGTEGPERYDGAFVSANIFDLLRVRPALGTSFRPGDDDAGAPLTVVLGYQAWQTRYESDASVVGRSVIVNGEPATILGVMPKGFMFPEDQELWVASRDSRPDEPDRARASGFQVFGRLKPGVTMDQAASEMALIAQRLESEYPESNEGITTRFQSFVQNDTGPELVAVLGAMQVATIFVLLIACANVANLLLARATLRTRESAVRTALGASRFRVVLPFFAETLLLSVAGAIVGVAIAYVGQPVRRSDAGSGQTVLHAVRARRAGTGVRDRHYAGDRARGRRRARLPRAAHQRDRDAQRRGTRSVGRAGRAHHQRAGGGRDRAVVRALDRRRSHDQEHREAARLRLPVRDRQQEMFRRLLDDMERLPGTRSASLSSSLPPSAGTWRIGIEGETYASPQDYPTAEHISVTPEFFETFDVPIVAGRNFTDRDAWDDMPVAIVNQPFADKYFPGEDPLGRRFKEGTSDTNVTWITIVGVVPDMRLDNFEPDGEREGFFRPLAQRDYGFVSLAVNTTRADALGLTPEVRQAVRSLDPNLPIYNVATEQGFIDQRMWFYRVFGTVFIVFGAAALFMATVGLYGVLSFSVSRRVREMGIRMALGANSRDVVRLIVRQGGLRLMIGLALGLALAYGLTRVIRILMFETAPHDPPVFTVVVLIIAAVGLLASFVPANRATRVDPMVALRYE